MSDKRKMNGEKKTVLVVDDAPANIHVVNEILRDTYKVRIATNGARARVGRRDAGSGFDSAGCDHAGMDGYEVATESQRRRATFLSSF
jgi:CheY-like chemotaxis protein